MFGFKQDVIDDWNRFFVYDDVIKVVRDFLNENFDVKFYVIGYSFGGVLVVFYVGMLYYNSEMEFVEKFVVVYIFGQL